VDRFGTIHGVFHLAGVAPYGLMPFKTMAAAIEVMSPKIDGTRILQNALREIPLDFFVLFSSLSSLTGGGPGQVDYCAANAFLDAFAAANPDRNGRLTAISWGAWERDAWQESLWGLPDVIRDALIERRRQYGITMPGGFEALDRILRSRLRHVIVSPRPLNDLLEENRRLSVPSLLDQAAACRQSQPVAPRPELNSVYTEPSTADERRIAALWCELLNIERVGVDDDFFELGGNSLIAVQLIARLRVEAQAGPIAADAFFEVPTVRTMARHLSDVRQT